MNEAVVGCGDQSMKQLFATHPELEDGLLIGMSKFFYILPNKYIKKLTL